MTVVFALLVLAVITVGVLMILKAPMANADATDVGLQPPPMTPLPAPISAADLKQVRFPVVFRGYRMADVDDVLARLAEQLAAKEAHMGAEPSTGPDDQQGAPVNRGTEQL